MALFYDRIGFETASTGTGAITAGSAIEGMRTFAQAGASDGETVRYLIEQGAEWELVEGVLSSSASTLSRANTLASSNSGSPINLASGGAQVYCTPMARDVNKIAVDLTHTAGAITLDVQAADLYRFEADEYVSAGDPSFVSAAVLSSTAVSLHTVPGIQHGDQVLVLFTGNGTSIGIPSGWTEEFKYLAGNRLVALYSYEYQSGDTTFSWSGSTSNIRGGMMVVRSAGLDVPIKSTAADDNKRTEHITTVTDDCLIAVLSGYVNGSENLTSWTEPAGFTDHLTSQHYAIYAGVMLTSDPVLRTGFFNPPDISHGTNLSYPYSYQTFTAAFSPPQSDGEKDYTFTFSNAPASGIASGLLDLELKTDTGSVAFAGGTISWRGAVPSFDEAGKYLIAFWADSSGIMLLDLTAAVSAGGAMSGAAIVSAINAQLGGSTWQGGAGGGVALWKAKGNNQGNNYANTSADVGWNAWAIDGGSDLTLSGAQITAVTAGTYLFAVTVRANGDNRVELRIQAHRDTGSGFSALADEIVDDYIMRDTDQDRGAVTLHCALELSAGDKIKFVAEGNVDGACTGLAAGTSLIAQKVA